MHLVNVTQKFLLIHCLGVVEELKRQWTLGMGRGPQSCTSGSRSTVALINSVALVSGIGHHLLSDLP